MSDPDIGYDERIATMPRLWCAVCGKGYDVQSKPQIVLPYVCLVCRGQAVKP